MSNTFLLRGQALALLLLFCTCVRAQNSPVAPEPPIDTRWIVNDAYTDEFSGEELDQEKWFDYHPRWKGRQPAIFLPRSVTVEDGNLRIQNSQLEQDTTVTFFDGSTGTYSIGGGAVVSREIGAYHGYYEVRLKASDIRMSSTFWMSNSRTEGECPNYSLELDIIETIGGASPGNAGFTNRMKSNTHYYQTDCNGNTRAFSQGGDGPIGGDSSEEFHTYGCWWVNENEMIFYIDGEESHRIMANTGASAAPFDRPMHINMVTETYDWETPPGPADLSDDNRNTSYYDFVHAFELLDVDTPEPIADDNLVVNPGFETGDFSGWTGWGGFPREVVTISDAPEGSKVVRIVGGGAPEQIVRLEANTEYILGATARIVQGQVALGIKSTTSDDIIASVLFTETDWIRKTVTFTTGDETELKFFFFAMAGGNEGFADAFTLTKVGESAPSPPALTLTESFRFSNLPELTTSAETINVNCLYQANEERVLRLRLLNERGNQVGDDLSYTALPGYGHKQLTFPLPDGVLADEVFTLEGTMINSPDDGGTPISTGRLLMTVNGTTTSTLNHLMPAYRIFPNPADDDLRVEGAKRGETIRIIDLFGRVVLTSSLGADNRVEIHDLPKGVYFAQPTGRRPTKFIKR